MQGNESGGIKLLGLVGSWFWGREGCVWVFFNCEYLKIYDHDCAPGAGLNLTSLWEEEVGGFQRNPWN